MKASNLYRQDGRTSSSDEAVPNTDGHNVDADFFGFGQDLLAQRELDPSPITSFASGITNALLMVCFSAAYGLIMFNEVWHVQHVAVGVKMNLVSGAVLGLGLACSGEKVLMGGPDIQTAVFYGSALSKMGKHVASKVGLAVPQTSSTSRRLFRNGFLYSTDDVVSPEEDPTSLFSFFGEAPLYNWAHSLNVVAGRDSDPQKRFAQDDSNINGSKELPWQDSRFLQENSTEDANNNTEIDAQEFCAGSHYSLFKDQCDDYHKKFRATAIAAISFGSFGTGLIFLLLGVARSTRYVEFIPRGIVDAILACLGYQVFVYGLLFCSDKPSIFLPSVAVGVPFYFVISGPLLHPVLMVPLFISGSVGAFYVMLQSSGSTIEKARTEGLMFPEVPNAQLWEVYSESFFKPDDIQWDSWTEMWPDMVSLWGMLLLDGLVQLRMTEEMIPLSISKNMVYFILGVSNLVAGGAGGSAGCSQLSLNVCNYAIIRNTKDRLAGVLCALICLGSAFAPVDYLNYFPRHFFGMLLFCSGSRFVAEHLWNSRKYLSTPEWLQIIIIVGVFVLWDEITYALLTSVVLVAGNFITKYAKIPCVEGKPLHGGEVASRERHSPLMTRCLQHIANNWVLVIRLKSFCFFASVHGVIEHVRGIIDQQQTEGVPYYRRLKFLVFDCTHLDGIDSAASKDFQRLRDEAHGHGIAVFWASVSPSVLKIAKKRGTILKDADVFHDLGEAMLFIEQAIRVFRHTIEERWVSLHPMFAQAQEVNRLRDNFEPFKFIFTFDASRFGCPWMYVSKKSITAHKTVLWQPGWLDVELFLIHTGAVGIFDKMPDPSDGWDPPKVVYKHGWFLNRHFLVREATKGIAVALEDGELLCWNTHQWWRMTRERPLMASAIMEAAMRQAGFDASVMQNQLKLYADGDVDEETGQVDMSHLDLAEKDFMQHDVPHDLQVKIEGIEAAQFLKEFKLFEPISTDDTATALPELPRKIRDDLAIAFYTFASDDARPMLPGKKVKETLMYAGIFNMLVGMKEMDRPMDEKEFMAIGHEMAMARLSKKQVSKIYNIFKNYDKDKSGQLDRDEMVVIFRETIAPNISEEEVNGICGAWDDNGSGKIDAKEFVGILARFIRKHEQDWNILVGFRDILQKKKKESITMTDCLTSEMLMANRNINITQEEAEEMLWACDCFDLEGDGKSLDFAGMVAGVLLSTEYQFGKLPPMPRKPPKKGVAPSNANNNQVPSGSASNAKAPQKKIPMSNFVNDSDSDEEIVVGQRRMSAGSAEVTPREKNLKNELLGYRKEVVEQTQIPDTFRAKVHLFLNYPMSSCMANVYSTCMCLLIVASFVQLIVTTFIISESNDGSYCPKNMPYPYYSGYTWCCAQNKEKVYAPQGRSCDGSELNTGGFVSKCCNGGVQTKCESPPCKQYADPDSTAYDIVNLVINIIFGLEYLVRLLVCDALNDYTTCWRALLAFVFDPLNLCDLFATLPYWINLIFKTGDSSFWRLLRLGRVIHVSDQHASKAGKNLSTSSRRSNFVLPALVVFAVVWGVYWKENNPIDLPTSR